MKYLEKPKTKLKGKDKEILDIYLEVCDFFMYQFDRLKKFLTK